METCVIYSIVDIHIYTLVLAWTWWVSIIATLRYESELRMEELKPTSILSFETPYLHIWQQSHKLTYLVKEQVPCDYTPTPPTNFA